MDGLLAEISAKRKALALEVDDHASSSSSGAGAKKYMRRADVERAREEEERRIKAEASKAKAEMKEKDRAARLRKEAESARLASLKRLAASPTPGVTSGGTTPEPSLSSTIGEKEGFNISPEECIRRLRSKGQPIRLFGESDKERRLRLRALELLEEKGDKNAGRNDFKRYLEEMESGLDKKDVEKKARESHRLNQGAGGTPTPATTTETGTGTGAGTNDGDGDKKEGTPAADGQTGTGTEEKRKKGVDMGILDLGLIKTDPNKLYPLVYYALKNVLKEWEEWMDCRPEEIRRSTQGKMAAALQVQSAQNLKPLFKSLRSREMPPDVIRHLAEIVHHMQSRSYQRANDAYLRLSIGNAAWPIGVTSVGIHERSAREKIGQDNIAHVLNDEVSRKYIQAVKRLLTFSQTIRPPDDVSQLMG